MVQQNVALAPERDDSDEDEFPAPRRGGYNYAQHLKVTGRAGGVFLLKSGQVIPSHERPAVEHDEFMAMYQQERTLEETKGNNEEVDPEVMDALENFDEGNYETFDDDFLAELRAGPQVCCFYFLES